MHDSHEHFDKRLAGRRASEPALSDQDPASPSPEVTERIPLPLPYLPSDYEPSPSSPRHRFLQANNEAPIPHQDLLSLPPGLGDSFSRLSMRRQRSQSAGSTDPDALVSSATVPYRALMAPATNSHTGELVPYREWTVISQNDASGQIVLYNRESRLVTVRQHLPSNQNQIPPNASSISMGEKCPLCQRPFTPSADHVNVQSPSEPNFMDRNYFRLLASTPIQSPATSRRSTPHHTQDHVQPDARSAPPSDRSDSAIRLNANAFNQGYYSKFFVEQKKLGRGFRGSVYMCDHELDGVKLGKYAVKKVAVGNNHPWLVKMLREVHLLERLRHPNIINYKHAWLEYNRFTPFGPEVPCLFILMECANGGNLEEYLEPEVTEARPQPTVSNKRDRKAQKRDRIRRQLGQQGTTSQPNEAPSVASNVRTQRRLLSMPEIWSLFLDIVEGLAHLHQHNIVHRDLKPNNLLLKWDDRVRDHDNEWRGAFEHHRGIPRVLISDFGECEDLESTPDSDRTGATGTLEFMAPEHVRMDPSGRHIQEYSPKADMWSLGMVLYYLCYTRLPYSNIDDFDVLREEILGFKEIRFPRSRLDGNVYVDPNDNITSDIPNELKLLIRVLLSQDPEKRPSCEEILPQLRQMRPHNGRNHTNNTRRRASWQAPPSMMKSEPSALGMGGKISALPLEEEPCTANTSAPTIQPLSNGGPEDNPERHERASNSESMDMDMDMDLDPQRSSEKRDAPGHSQEGHKKRRMDRDWLMLSAAPALPRSNAKHKTPRWISSSLSDIGYMGAVKTVTAILKIATCTYPCYPYSPWPMVLYPIILLAILDFWSESVLDSLVLVALHLVWVVCMAVLSGGICVA